MHTYRKEREENIWLYTVGYFDPSGKFYPIEDFGNEMKARKLVNYLNGGIGNYEADTLQVAAHVETGY